MQLAVKSLEFEEPVTARQTEFPLNVVVCAWCQPRQLGDSLGAISHGICPRHFRKLEREIKGIRYPRRPHHARRPEPEALLPL